MKQALRDKAIDIIGLCKDMTVATIREDGAPQATVVSFVHDGMTLYFGCGAHSQKARNMAREARVSVAMTAPYESWSEIRGVSMGATAHEVSSPAEMEQVAGLLLERFTQIQEIEPIEPTTVKLFKLTPYVISVLDYTLGFGHTDSAAVTDSDLAETLESMAHHWVAKPG